QRRAAQFIDATSRPVEAQRSSCFVFGAELCGHRKRAPTSMDGSMAGVACAQLDASGVQREPASARP
ncbi:MAG: hypothetical protein OEW34_03225, partial [Burkholderiaceae bacterium]|nr:hypothetical protein [Burkholderiaceae bacterium]